MLGGLAGLGGLGAARPDQQYFPPSAGLAPGPRTNIRARQVIVIGGGASSGLFVYNGTPALGNPPVFSVVAPGVTADPFGNTVAAVMEAGSIGTNFMQVDQFGNLLLYSGGNLNIVLNPTKQGLFAYSPGAGLGNMVSSIAAAGGTDPYTNVYFQGATTYNKVGATYYATQCQGQITTIYTATSEAGPWTLGIQSKYDVTTGKWSFGPPGAPKLNIPDGVLAVNVESLAQLICSAGLQVTGGLTTDTEAISTAAATGAVLAITNTVTGTGTLIVATVAGASQRWFGGQVTGDTNNRITLATDASSNPQIGFGSGAASPDGFIKRTVANRVDVVGADLDIATLGRGLQINEGANARMGIATLVAGAAVVNNTTVTANTRIFLTPQATGGTVGAIRVSGRTPGTSFTIASNQAGDTSPVAWLMIEPG